MLCYFTAAVPVRVAFRDLKRVGTRDPTSFGAQWLAYTLPCGRFAVTRAGANARLGASTLFCQTQHRALPSLRKRALGPEVELHPAAEARGIANGDWVSIETPQGMVRARARLNDNLDPRVVVGEHGWWQPCAEIGAPGYDPFGPMGANFNLLIGSAALDPVSGVVNPLCAVAPASGAPDHVPRATLEINDQLGARAESPESLRRTAHPKPVTRAKFTREVQKPLGIGGQSQQEKPCGARR